MFQRIAAARTPKNKNRPDLADSQVSAWRLPAGLRHRMGGRSPHARCRSVLPRFGRSGHGPGQQRRGTACRPPATGLRCVLFGEALLIRFQGRREARPGRPVPRRRPNAMAEVLAIHGGPKAVPDGLMRPWPPSKSSSRAGDAGQWRRARSAGTISAAGGGRRAGWYRPA